MPTLTERKFLRNGRVIFVHQCSICTFTSTGTSEQASYDAAIVHEIGHQFGNKNSKNFPKTIDDYRAAKGK